MGKQPEHDACAPYRENSGAHLTCEIQQDFVRAGASNIVPDDVITPQEKQRMDVFTRTLSQDPCSVADTLECHVEQHALDQGVRGVTRDGVLTEKEDKNIREFFANNPCAKKPDDLACTIEQDYAKQGVKIKVDGTLTSEEVHRINRFTGTQIADLPPAKKKFLLEIEHAAEGFRGKQITVDATRPLYEQERSRMREIETILEDKMVAEGFSRAEAERWVSLTVEKDAQGHILHTISNGAIAAALGAQGFEEAHKAGFTPSPLPSHLQPARKDTPKR